MEELFSRLISRKRCSSDDLDHERAKLFRGETTENEVVAKWREFDLDPGTDVWLTSLDDLPTLNGEHCKVLRKSTPALISSRRLCVRRICTGETLEVSPQNLTQDEPEGIDACAKVLARALGQELAERILKFSTCLRCWQSCTPGSVCQVPHPAVQREFVYEISHNLSYCYCRACDTHFDFSHEHNRVTNRQVLPKGYSYCFEGQHTTRRPRNIDRRRCVPPIASLRESRTLQFELDALPEHVSSLAIWSESGHPKPSGFGEEYRLEVALPNLWRFDTDMEGFEVMLNKNLTPKLAELCLHHAHIWGEISLPDLKLVEIYFSSVEGWIKDMLAVAGRLECVNLHNVRTGKELQVASNALKEIRLAHVTDLEEISIWGPNLGEFVIGDCESLQIISFLNEHDLKSELPTDYFIPTLKVNLISEISRAARDSLDRHPNMILTEAVQE